MFTGSFLFNIDDKGRVSLPMRLRKEFNLEIDKTIVLIYFSDKCILAYPYSEWVKKAEEINSYNENKEIGRVVKRMLNSRTFEVVMDKQYRVLIPQNLLDYANIQKNSPVMIIGNGEKIEIWNPDEYNRYIEPHTDNLSSYLELLGG